MSRNPLPTSNGLRQRQANRKVGLFSSELLLAGSFPLTARLRVTATTHKQFSVRNGPTSVIW
jgi:hypothetical protein